MMKRSKVIGILLLVLAAMAVLLLAGCGSQQPASASASSAASSSAAGQASSSAASPSTAAAGSEDVVTISLDYNAGTGYEWNYTMEPEGVLAEVSHETEDQSSHATAAGGPLSDKFTFRAAKPGEVVLTFNLARSWEGEPAETQVYAFTVSSDMKMVLNPYKSNFVNEPAWGSNS